MCYSPPSALKIKQGDKVKVEGWLYKSNIRAERIKNIAKGGPSCQCGIPRVVARVRPEWTEKTGIAQSVIVTSAGIQFVLETP